ncbi:MAG: hypothetical protein JWO91_1750 [Acidobacteriaceae bacterium]|nr:hypothetical protein [Acidobacteriaceae bacterium]
MKISRIFLSIVVSVLLAAFVSAAETPSGNMLPKDFAGWHAQSPIKTSTDPAAADPINAALIKEYGFNDLESATYTREDGRKLTIKAARFQDASGAYGAFTYYKLPQMLVEKIGDQGASLNERVLFYRGNILVDAVFQNLTAMSAAELRELADGLALPPGNTGKLPGLPRYLPSESYVKNTAKYIVGPVGLAKLDIPGQLVDFNSGAEVVEGTYNTSAGNADLILVSYPTPQIAAEQLRKIDAARLQGPNNSSTPVVNSPMFDKRTGPIVVIAMGPLSQSEAKSLLASVNYEADVTWNENTYFTKKDNIGNLVVNVIYLCGIIGGFAIVAGIAFGGVRVLVKRLWPDRVFDRAEDVELISLHLSHGAPQPPQIDGKSLN